MPATTLDDAYQALELKALGPDDPLYVQTTIPVGRGRQLPPLARLRGQLLKSSERDRFFLSGHIGSGKSTELKRLLADPDIQRRFYVVAFDIEPEHQPSLASHELLFLIAARLYARASADKTLVKFERSDRWLGMLQRIDAALYSPTGLVAKGGKFGLSFDLFFVKLSQELAVEQGRRREFRGFAETQGSVLVELIDALVDDIGTALVHAGLPHRVLIVVDDLEKLRSNGQFTEIFDTNLGALLAPHVPILLTVPPSVTFGGPGGTLGRNVNHLRPIQVLRKTNALDPTNAEDPTGVAVMRSIFDARVGPGLFDAEVVREAALYSGGVVRDFFNLLRFAIIQAQLYGQDHVDEIAWEDTLTEEKTRFIATLYPKDKEALRAIREVHELADAGQLEYARRSVVIEHNHDGIWWEVAPMLWEWLDKV
ncbi:hypothetical protein WME77_09340 [Sorangium sp. So ce764]|uniref:hypothetical protein n=1 Tax=Sorangium sp. So ce764 TaxID=3133320 RepID=UPI003F5E9AD3